MELEQLRALVAVAELRSISKAAQSLHISQPALSVRIKSLEQSLGVPLIVRNYEGAIPTEWGEIAVEAARRVLGVCEGLTAEIKGKTRTGELLVGATPTMGGYILPHLLAQFSEILPNVRVSLTVSFLSTIHHQVADGRMAIGFVEDVNRPSDVAFQEVGADQLHLICSPDLGLPSSVSLEAALALPHVLCIPECGKRQVLERELRGIDRSIADLKVVAELDSLDAIKTMVENSACVAWLPRRVVLREIQAQSLMIVSVPQWPVKFKYGAIFPAGRAPSLAATRFVALVRERLRPRRR